MEEEKSTLEKYWDHLKKRLEDEKICITSRESVKESIVSYDVKHEMNYPGCALERMCRYKLAGYYNWSKHGVNKDSFDCDVAEVTMWQYAIAFPFVLKDNRSIKPYESKKYEMRNIEKVDLFHYRGDTMNSYATVVHKFLVQYNHKEEDVKGFLERTKRDRNKWGVAKGSEYDKKFSKKHLHWEACILDHLDYFNSILPEEAKTFIRLNHTIGNFIPFPAGCNSSRGMGATKDFWDLALNHIYNWYQENESIILPENAHLTAVFGLEDPIENFQRWLAYFGKWDEFIKQNHLQNFVNGPEEGPFGKPYALWENHLNEKAAVKPNGSQCEGFFENASCWIKARGERIAEKIVQELEKTPGCHPWKKDT